MTRFFAALLSVVVAAPSWAVPAPAPVLLPAGAGAPRPASPAPESGDAWAADAQLLADHLEAGVGDAARLTALRGGFLDLRGRWPRLPRAEREELSGVRERLNRAGREVLGEEPVRDPEEDESAEPPARRDLDSVSDSVERAGLYFDQARAAIPGGFPVVVPGEGAEPPAVFRLTHPKRPQPGARIHVGRGLSGVPPARRRATLRALAAAALGALGRGAPPTETLESFVDWLEKESAGPGGRLRRDLVVEVTPALEVFSRAGAGPRKPGPRLKPWDSRRAPAPPAGTPSAPPAPPAPKPASGRVAGRNHFAQRIKLGKGFAGGGGGGGGGSRRGGGRRGGGGKRPGGGGAKGLGGGGKGGGGVAKRGDSTMSGRAGGGRSGGRGVAGGPGRIGGLAGAGGPGRSDGAAGQVGPSMGQPMNGPAGGAPGRKAPAAGKAAPRGAGAAPAKSGGKGGAPPPLYIGFITPAPGPALPSAFVPFGPGRPSKGGKPAKGKAKAKAKAEAGKDPARAVDAARKGGRRGGVERTRPAKLIRPGGKRGGAGQGALLGELRDAPVGARGDVVEARAQGRQARVGRRRKKAAASGGAVFPEGPEAAERGGRRRARAGRPVR